MSDELPAYNLVRCNTCNYFFGKHKNSKIDCPRCKTSLQNLDIISRTDDAEELHNLVSLNNMPIQLRKEFEGKDNFDFQKNNHFELKDIIPELLNNSKNDEGLVILRKIEHNLNAKGIKLKALKLVETAEFEGLLIRVSEGKWRLIG